MKKSLPVIIVVILVAGSFIFVLSRAYYDNHSLDLSLNSEATDTGPVVVGVVLPLSGESAVVGTPIRRSIELATKEINDQGGVLGRQLQLELRDGKCSARLAAEAAEALILKQKVSVILGGACSSETLAIAPIAERAGVILFSPASTSPAITSAGDYVFRNAPSDTSQGLLLAEMAVNRGYSKVGVLLEETDYAVGISQVFKSNFTALGGTVVEKIYNTADRSVALPLTALKNEEVEALLMVVQSPGKVELIVRTLKTLPWSVPLLANDVVLGATDTLATYAKTVEGLIGADLDVTETLPYEEFIEKYESLYGEKITYPFYAALSYDAMNLISTAIEAVGVKSDDIRDYLYTVKNVKGVAGVLTLDQYGDPLSGHVLKQIINGIPSPIGEQI